MLADAFTAWQEGSGTQAAPARARLICAARWALAAADAGLAAEAADGYATAVSLLPLAAWHGLDRATREGELALWGSMTIDAAAWAITGGHPQRAVELLEQGRSILWSQLLQTRDDVDDLRAADPDMAQRLDSIRASLDGHAADPAISVEQRMHAAAEWDALLEQIRSQPGFRTFLAIPPLTELSAATAAGPVIIINVSEYRCDALAVTTSGIQVIPLPKLTRADANQNAATFHKALARVSGTSTATLTTHADAQRAIDSVLAWLWTAVTGPVISALGLIRHRSLCDPDTAPTAADLVVPTGALTHLPLHAAAPAPGAAWHPRLRGVLLHPDSACLAPNPIRTAGSKRPPTAPTHGQHAGNA